MLLGFIWYTNRVAIKSGGGMDEEEVLSAVYCLVVLFFIFFLRGTSITLSFNC